MASLAEQIRNKNAEFLQALHNHDAAAMAAMYSHDARLLAPGSEIAESPGKIQAFWSGVIESGITDAKLDTLEVDMLGGYTAMETGKFTLYAGKSTVDRGKYMVIWRNEDGLWKLHRDIWNSSVPLPKAVGV